MATETRIGIRYVNRMPPKITIRKQKNRFKKKNLAWEPFSTTFFHRLCFSHTVTGRSFRLSFSPLSERETTQTVRIRTQTKTDSAENRQKSSNFSRFRQFEHHRPEMSAASRCRRRNSAERKHGRRNRKRRRYNIERRKL
jgi:hypothetical protein